MSCCIVKIEHKKAGTVSSRKGNLKVHFEYLDKDNAKLLSKMTPNAFVEKYPTLKTYYITISAENTSVDTHFLTDVFLDLVKQKTKRKPDYVAYEHNDTAHPHIHLVIPDSSHYCKYNLDGTFYLKASRHLSTEIEKKYGKISEFEIRKNYACLINKDCATKIDFDIGKIALRDNDGNFVLAKTDNLQFYEKQNIEDWKRPIIRQRLDYLCEIGIAKQTEDSVLLEKKYRQKLLEKGKLGHLTDQYKSEDVKFVSNVSKKDISEIVVQKEERLKVKSLVRTNDGELKYYERMLPKHKRKYDEPDRSQAANILGIEAQRDFILQEEEKRKKGHLVPRQRTKTDYKEEDYGNN